MEKLQDMEWEVKIEFIVYAKIFLVEAMSKTISFHFYEPYVIKKEAKKDWKKFAKANGITKYKYVD